MDKEKSKPKKESPEQYSGQFKKPEKGKAFGILRNREKNINKIINNC